MTNAKGSWNAWFTETEGKNFLVLWLVSTCQPQATLNPDQNSRLSSKSVQILARGPSGLWQKKCLKRRMKLDEHAMMPEQRIGHGENLAKPFHQISELVCLGPCASYFCLDIGVSSIRATTGQTGPMIGSSEPMRLVDLSEVPPQNLVNLGIWNHYDSHKFTLDQWL